MLTICSVESRIHENVTRAEFSFTYNVTLRGLAFTRLKKAEMILVASAVCMAVTHHHLPNSIFFPNHLPVSSPPPSLTDSHSEENFADMVGRSRVTAEERVERVYFPISYSSFKKKPLVEDISSGDVFMERSTPASLPLYCRAGAWGLPA